MPPKTGPRRNPKPLESDRSVDFRASLSFNFPFAKSTDIIIPNCVFSNPRLLEYREPDFYFASVSTNLIAFRGTGAGGWGGDLGSGTGTWLGWTRARGREKLNFTLLMWRKRRGWSLSIW